MPDLYSLTAPLSIRLPDSTDPALAAALAAWRQYLATHPDDYPRRPLIEAIARRYGATP